jgi:hypothetical protein
MEVRYPRPTGPQLGSHVKPTPRPRLAGRGRCLGACQGRVFEYFVSSARGDTNANPPTWQEKLKIRRKNAPRKRTRLNDQQF